MARGKRPARGEPPSRREPTTSSRRRPSDATCPSRLVVPYGLASRTRLNGVSATRVKFVKPAAVTILRRRRGRPRPPGRANTACAEGREGGVSGTDRVQGFGPVTLRPHGHRGKSGRSAAVEVSGRQRRSDARRATPNLGTAGGAHDRLRCRPCTVCPALRRASAPR
jgi:hypothetical protein